MRKKISFVLLSLCLMPSILLSQDNAPQIGYRMMTSPTLIQVYRDDNGVPNTSTFKRIDNSVWFSCDTSFKLTHNAVEYFRILIPNGNTAPNTDTSSWAQSGQRVSSIDFNKPLWIKVNDLRSNVKNEFARVKGQFPTFGGLTVPFRVRPQVNSYPSSIFNGDFNIGAYFGGRIAFADRFGINIVGSFGISSLNQNASNNSSIKDTTFQSMTAMTYGAGFIFDWAKKFQLGLVIGRDNGFGSLSPTYIYQNRTWFALSFNYKFLGEYKTETDKGQ